MARTTWINPNNSAQKVLANSTVAPATSPAPAGNPVVPTGYIRQIGQDGFMDTGSFWDQTGTYQPNIFQPGMPTYTGGWPADPLLGSPWHTAHAGVTSGSGVQD